MVLARLVVFLKIAFVKYTKQNPVLYRTLLSTLLVLSFLALIGK